MKKKNKWKMKYYSHYMSAETNMFSQVPTFCISIQVWIPKPTLDIQLFHPNTTLLFLLNQEDTLVFILLFLLLQNSGDFQKI